jgi:hypothetical protein
MGAAVSGMLATIGWWLVLLVVLFGVGCLALRLLGRSVENAEEMFTAFWVGWGVCIAGLQVWHLFAPIGPSTFAVIATAAVAGLAASRESLVRGAGFVGSAVRSRPRESRWLVIVAGLALLWLANRALGPITPQGDAGLYHVGTVRWLQAHAIVPGLANLDGRFGFNSASFLYLALLDLRPGPPHFHHLGVPVLLIAFTLQSWMYLIQLVRRRERAEGHVFMGALWVMALVPYYFNEFASTSTDMPGLLLGFLLGIHTFKIVLQPLTARQLGFEAGLVIFYTAIGISTKLSFAFLGVGASAIAALCFLEQVREESGRGWLAELRARFGQMLLIALMVSAILVPWLTRGVILTGYVAYPSQTAIHLDVDWKVDEAQVIMESDKIKMWARVQRYAPDAIDELMSSWSWFVPWLGRTLLRADLFTYPWLLFGLACALQLRRPRLESYEVRTALRFLTPPFIAIILWFVTAPAERFGGAIFWLVGAGSMAILFHQLPAEDFKRKLVSWNLSLVALSCVATLIASAAFSHTRYGWWLFVPPGSEAGFHPIPAVESRARRTADGLTVYAPVRITGGSSKWSPKPFCWDVPLPCTRRLHDDLVLRDVGNVANGFRRAGRGGE